MDGREIYRFATDAKVYRTILDAAEMEILEEDTYFIPHQANLRILRKMQETNSIADSQFYVNGIQTIGNTAAVSVFLGLYDVLRNNLAPNGTKHYLLGAFGMGGKSGGALLTVNGSVLLV
jgi:3-oxoacyl-[acyl-carrier-protein] synthase-3